MMLTVCAGGGLLRDEDVAFVVHGWVEGEVGGGEKLAGLGAVGAEESDGEVGGGVGGVDGWGYAEAALGQGWGEVLRGEHGRRDRCRGRARRRYARRPRSPG